MEECEDSRERAWYLRAALERSWTKAELLGQVQAGVWLQSTLDEQPDPAILREIQCVWECLEHEEDPFLCVTGNICRSPMAEYIMKDLVKKAGLEDQFQIASAATSTEEIGNPVYPPARRKLAEHGISCEGKTARQMTRRDYETYDYLIAMDHNNLRNMARFVGGDPEHKVSLLMDHTRRPGDVADPWYTGDFEATWQDVLEGCTALLEELR